MTMAYILKPNSGALFKNRDRSNSKAPDARGYTVVEIDGELHHLELSAWNHESARAGKWLALTEKLKPQERPSAKESAQGVDTNSGDAVGAGQQQADKEDQEIF